MTDVIDETLLKILVCPEDKSTLKLAQPDLLEKLNQKISGGGLKNRSGAAIEEPLTAGLVRADGRYLYPIRDNIPVMLIEEAIQVDSL